MRGSRLQIKQAITRACSVHYPHFCMETAKGVQWRQWCTLHGLCINIQNREFEREKGSSLTLILKLTCKTY